MRKIIFILVFSALSLNIQAQIRGRSSDEGKMAWWKDAKFGMFIHWGVYAVPAGIYREKQVPGIGEWIMNTAKIPVAEYQLFAKDFDPNRYDPEAWVRVAKAAGMKYIVITAKHHDGFAMFDSKVTDWGIMHASPYGKDVLRLLVEACHNAGLKIGFYYSQAQDWNHPGGVASGGHWDRAQDGSFDAYLDKIAVPQVRELLSNYGDVDILWWDTPQDMTAARAEKFLPLLKEHPNLITNNRLGGGYNGDTETPEQFVPATGFPGRNWEACMTMNDTWGYKSYDENWKSPQTLIRNLVDVVSKGGNFLLNVGPNALGEIPRPSVTRLAEIGDWIKINKDAIYETSASPFPYLSWGRATQKNSKLYLHVFDYPADRNLKVPMTSKIFKAYLLSDVQKRILPIVKTANGWSVKLPSVIVDSINTVVVLELAGKPQVLPSPIAGLEVTVSSQKNKTSSGRNLTDGDRLTSWEAAKGERKAVLTVDLQKSMLISTLIVDEPWHPWENKKQHLQLQYKRGEEWVTLVTGMTAGVGYTANFKPVRARSFRLSLENKDAEPALLEWQLFGPE